MSVVITGVAGFIGSHLAERLLTLGEEVIGVDCFTDYYDVALKQANIKPLCQHARFRLWNLDLAVVDLAPLPVDVECVFHLAGQPGVRGSWGNGFSAYVRNNIVATQRLLESLRGSSARLVFASSSSVYGDATDYPTPETSVPQPISPYGVTKLSCEQLVMAYRRSMHVDARCVRYFTVYGPRQRPDMAFSKFISAASRGDTIDVYGDGEQSREFTFVSDAVEATILAGAVDDPGDAIFNVGGGSRVTVRQALVLLGDIMGRPIGIRTLGPQAGDARDTGADLRRSLAVLQWRPRVSLRQGLTAQVDAAGVAALQQYSAHRD